MKRSNAGSEHPPGRRQFFCRSIPMNEGPSGSLTNRAGNVGHQTVPLTSRTLDRRPDDFYSALSITGRTHMPYLACSLTDTFTQSTLNELEVRIRILDRHAAIQFPQFCCRDTFLSFIHCCVPRLEKLFRELPVELGSLECEAPAPCRQKL